MTAHLAAGFANYEERNRDYHTISHGLRFQRNRSIEDHDAIIWLGDFNYRIGLSDERARQLIKGGDIDTLYQNDQVKTIAGKLRSNLADLFPTAAFANGSWTHISLLFRIKDYFFPDVQI